MTLNLDQIRSVTTGAIQVQKLDDGYHFIRCLESQRLGFGKLGEVYYNRANCTAGIHLDFDTDSSYVKLSVSAAGKYEVFVNGEGVCFFHPMKPASVWLDLPEGNNNVRIMLPHQTVGVISAVELSDGASLSRHVFKRKILFTGDSITQGANATRDSLCYADVLGRHYEAEVMNIAVGGGVFEADSLEDVGFDPDYVFVAFGTNDYVRRSSLAHLQEECRRYLDKVKDLFPTKKVICISPLWRGNGDSVRATGNFHQCCDAIIQEINDHGFIHINGYDMIPHDIHYFSDRHLHPNDSGFALYSENLIAAVKEYFED